MLLSNIFSTGIMKLSLCLGHVVICFIWWCNGRLINNKQKAVFKKHPLSPIDHLQPCVTSHLMHEHWFTLKPCSWFSLATFKSSPTSLPIWAQMMFVYLQTRRAESSARFAKPRKSRVSNQFSPLSPSGRADLLQVLSQKLLIAVMSFQWQTQIPGSARNSPALHSHSTQVNTANNIAPRSLRSLSHHLFP